MVRPSMVLAILALTAGCAAQPAGTGDYARHMRGAGTAPPASAASQPPAPDDEGRAIAAEALASVRPGAGRAAPERRQGDADPGAPMPAGAALIRGGATASTAPPGGGAGRPNIVAYALRTRHGVGEERFSRSILTLQSTARNCAAYASADLAQEAFLREGGPERDPMNLDPDGDGFACGWSPEPYRAAARADD